MSSSSRSSKVVEVRETYIEEGNSIVNNLRLRKFQEDLYLAIGQFDEVLLKAPTGSGKTFTLLMTLLRSLDNNLPSVGIYPSKALVYDQARSIFETLKLMGFREKQGNEYYKEFEGEFIIQGKIVGGGEKRIRTEFLAAVITGDTSKEVFKNLEKYVPVKPIMVLTVPEYPYLFMTTLGRYSEASKLIEASVKRSLNEHLGIPRTVIRDIFNDFARFFNGYLFIDEFHLYTGITRSSLNALIKMYKFFNLQPVGGYKTIIYSSATPIGNFKKIIEAKTSERGSKIRKRTKVLFHLVSGDPQEELVKESVNNVNDKSLEKKTGVILDRVYYLVEFCKKVNKTAGLVWGLGSGFYKCEKTNNPRNYDLIVGNSALSFGIDVPNLDLGFVHSHDAETLIQRIGRFGRKGEGEAEIHVFLKSSYKAIKELKEGEIDYYELVDIIYRVYDKRIDDGLDKINFSVEREKILFRTFLYAYYIAQGSFVKDIVEKNLPPVSNEIELLPSSEDYFNVFAFRPGGIKGKLCDGREEDLFTLLRNFKLTDSGCFTEEPIKDFPVLLIKGEVKEGRLVSLDEVIRTHSPRIVLPKQNFQTYMKFLKIIGNPYIIFLDKSSLGWNNFDDMVRLVSSYESALPVCKDTEKGTCDKYNYLALFI